MTLLHWSISSLFVLIGTEAHKTANLIASLSEIPDLSRKGTFSTCPKIHWKLDRFYTKLGKDSSQFIHRYDMYMHNIMTFWLWLLCSDWSKGSWICTLFTWLSYHTQLSACKSSVGKGKVRRIIDDHPNFHIKLIFMYWQCKIILHYQPIKRRDNKIIVDY